MKINETIERECCESKDLKNYQGLSDNHIKQLKPKFCIHCGQIWINSKEMGPAGSMEPTTEKIKILVNLIK